MATSGVITSSMTARQVVSSALELLGALDIGGTPTPEDAALALKHLTWMLKSWQVEGVGNRWRRESVEISWTADMAVATLSRNYISIGNIFYRSAGLDRVLTEISDEEYAAIPNKSQAGDPLVYNPGRTISAISLRIWPVPSSNITLYADGERVVEDVTSLDETLDIPQEWTETVFTGLAARLAAPMGLLASNPTLAAEIRDRAIMLRGLLSAGDAETASVFFAPRQER